MKTLKENQQDYYDYQGDNILIWEFLGRSNLLPPLPGITKEEKRKKYYRINREKIRTYQREYYHKNKHIRHDS